MGSANLNDRSQRGDGDSEIALVVEDTDLIETTMDGQKYMASRFAATLRRQLWRGESNLDPTARVLMLSCRAPGPSASSELLSRGARQLIHAGGPRTY
jgi:phospholipase D1/2